MMLMGKPHLPSLKGPYCGCLPASFRRTSRKIGIKYEMYSATVGNETRAVKATVDPILTSARIAQQTATRPRAGRGIWRVGWTCAMEC